MKKYLWDYVQLFSIAGVVVLIDQLTKTWVRLNLPIGAVYKPGSWLSQTVRIVHLNNRGAALGMFRDMSGLFVIIGAIVSLSIMVYFPRVPRKDRRLRLALGLLMGGAFGNPVERLLHQGYVTDFISIWNLPVFNGADASVFIGAVILILGLWTQDQRNKTSPGQIEKSKPAPPLNPSR